MIVSTYFSTRILCRKLEIFFFFFGWFQTEYTVYQHIYNLFDMNFLE